jgi:hypothetical protein
MFVSNVVGTIEPGMLVNGTGFTTQTVVSITAPVAPDVNYTIVLSAVASEQPSGTISFGIAVPAYLTIDPNALTNIVADGSSISALAFNNKVVPTKSKPDSDLYTDYILRDLLTCRNCDNNPVRVV